jgi:flagellum-specific peptidoglycan hydrolase FlgJ
MGYANNIYVKYREDIYSLSKTKVNLEIELSKKNYQIKHLKDSINNILSFSPENLRNFLQFYDIKHKDVVFNQALLETGNFSSNLFLQNNNLFGMKNPYMRPTTSIGENNNHAVYRHYIGSIKDYKLYQDWFYNSKSYNNYFDFLLRRNYAEDPFYISKLKNANK